MKDYKIGRYYIENLDQFRKDTRNNILERSTCLVLDKTLRSGDWEILEVNFFTLEDTFGRYYTSGTNTILDLNELGITIKRHARINEIFEFWIGLRNCKNNE